MVGRDIIILTHRAENKEAQEHLPQLVDRELWVASEALAQVAR